MDGLQKAYPLADLKKMEFVRDRVGEGEVVLRFHGDTEKVEIWDSEGNEVSHMIVY